MISVGIDVSKGKSEDTYQELKLLARQYYQTTSMLVKAKINFGTLCDQFMPGIQNIIYEHKGTEKIRSIVKRYLHFDNILKMSKNRFTTDYCKWAQKQGYRNCEQTAERLYTAAQNGIPVLPNSLSTTIDVTEAIRVLREIEASRNTILAQMLVLAKTLPEYQVVRSMSCIGDVLAPKLIAEIGDIRKFHNKHSLIAYAGIDPPPYQSGSFTLRNDISPKEEADTFARPDLRSCRVLFSISQSTSLCMLLLRKNAAKANAERKL